jgi:nucleotide sugar dehydrogenase
MASHLYEQIVPRVFRLYDPTEGEMTKLFENVQRDANLALTNEMAQICDQLGVNIINVINAASTKWNFYRLIPGCGVGGHCLPEDPYFLLEEINPNGIDHQQSIIRYAREINDSMPLYTVNKALSAMKNNGKGKKASKVAVLGLSYKQNVGDPRTSPAEAVIKELQKRSFEVIAHDPYIEHVPWAHTGSLEEALTNADAVILCTAHDEFNDIPEKISLFAPGSVFVDGRNKFNREDFESRGIKYVGIGG